MRYADRRLTPEAALRDLSHRDPRVRVQAADALGHLGENADPALAEKARAALRSALRDDDPEVRYATALSLGELRDAGAVPVLVEQIEADGHPLPRQAAVIALGLIGDRAAIPPLLRALQAAPPDVRFQAATSLAQLDPAAARAPLEQALHDPDAEVRAAAAAALGDIGDRQASAALAGLLEDLHPQAAFEAACALARLGDRRGTSVLLANLAREDLGLRAAEHLYRCPDPSAVPALRRRLDRWLTPRLHKAWLAAALARLGEPRGREVLVTLLWSRREMVRGLCIELLGEIGEPWAIDALQQMAASEAGQRWREELAAALSGHGPGTEQV